MKDILPLYKHLYVVIFSLCFSICVFSPALAESKSIHTLSATKYTGEAINFSKFKDKVLLIVNFSTKCGTTGQLKDLEKIYQKFKNEGFFVLGFPSEDFSKMDGKSNKEIHDFCAAKYGITFPVFATAPVTGDKIQPVYKFITEQCQEYLRDGVTFNSEKFLVGKDGLVKARFGPFTGALSSRLVKAIEEELKK